MHFFNFVKQPIVFDPWPYRLGVSSCTIAPCYIFILVFFFCCLYIDFWCDHYNSQSVSAGCYALHCCYTIGWLDNCVNAQEHMYSNSFQGEQENPFVDRQHWSSSSLKCHYWQACEIALGWMSLRWDQKTNEWRRRRSSAGCVRVSSRSGSPSLGCGSLNYMNMSVVWLFCAVRLMLHSILYKKIVSTYIFLIYFSPTHSLICNHLLLFAASFSLAF